MHNPVRLSLWGGLSLLVMLALIGMFALTPTSAAQPGGRTPRPTRDTSARTLPPPAGQNNGQGAADMQATIQAGRANSGDIQATANAFSVNFSQTATALSGGLSSTLGALSTQAASQDGHFAATSQALLTQVAGGGDAQLLAATAQALATQVSLDPNSIIMTATAVNYTGLTSEQQAALQAFLTGAAVSVDPATGALTATTTYNETAYNALLDSVALATGYNPSDISADLVPGGSITTFQNVTLDGLPGAGGGTLAVYAESYAAGGSIQTTLIWATYDGREIPVESVNWLVQGVITAAYSEAYTNTAGWSYRVDSLLISETALTLTVTLYVP